MIDIVPCVTASYPQVTFNRQPVRVALLDYKPWWDTRHIFGLVFRTSIDETLLETFDRAEMGWHHFEGLGTAPRHVVSTLGAQTIASQLPWRQNVMVNGWLRKQNLILQARPGYEPPRVPLSLLANGKLPLQPPAGVEYDEWKALSAAETEKRRSAEERLRVHEKPDGTTFIETSEERQARLLQEAAEQRRLALEDAAQREKCAQAAMAACPASAGIVDHPSPHVP